MIMFVPVLLGAFLTSTPTTPPPSAKDLMRAASEAIEERKFAVALENFRAAQLIPSGPED